MLLFPELGNDPLCAEAQLLHLVTAALATRLPHAEEVVQQRCGGDVEEDVHPHEAEVSPSLRPIDVGAVEVLIRNAESAVAAIAGSVWVLQSAGSHGQVGCEVLLTGLADVGRAENADFCCGTFYRSSVKHCCSYAGYPVCERRDTVHENPETGEGIGRLHDTTELDIYVSNVLVGRINAAGMCELTIKVMENKRVTIADAVCASGSAAMTSWPNVDA